MGGGTIGATEAVRRQGCDTAAMSQWRIVGGLQRATNWSDMEASSGMVVVLQ